ncbi:MAG: hypothetical protein ACR2NN_06920 [Bryobacteraceae bacterium]
MRTHLGTNATHLRVEVGSPEHEVRAGAANLGAIEQKANVRGLRVFAA